MVQSLERQDYQNFFSSQSMTLFLIFNLFESSNLKKLIEHSVENVVCNFIIIYYKASFMPYFSFLFNCSKYKISMDLLTSLIYKVGFNCKIFLHFYLKYMDIHIY